MGLKPLTENEVLSWSHEPNGWMKPELRDRILDLFKRHTSVRYDAELAERAKNLTRTLENWVQYRPDDAWADAARKTLNENAVEPSVERRRLKLWLHLVSEHKAQLDPFEPYESLNDMHQHEHTGPGTLGKGEPVEPLPFNMRSVGEVLSECEEVSPWDQDK